MDARWNEIFHKRQRIGSTVLTIFVLAAVLSNVVNGQTAATGALAGKVLDPSGAVIPGAEVHLMNHQTGDTDLSTSDAAGNFHFPLLPPASYELQVSKRG